MAAALFAQAVAVAVQHEMKKQSRPRDLAVVIGAGSNQQGA